MSNLTLVSWCPGGTCDPCKDPVISNFWCSTNLTVRTQQNIFSFSATFTGPVVSRATNQPWGDAPGHSGEGAAGWPGYIANTFVFPAAGYSNASSESNPVPLVHNGVVVNPEAGASGYSQVDYFDGDQGWGFVSMSGGYTWNETVPYGSDTISHTVGDGGMLSDADFIYYAETTEGPPDVYITDVSHAIYVSQLHKIWTRIERQRVTTTTTFLYFENASDYEPYRDAGYTSTYDGTQTIYNVGSLNSW